MSRYKKVQGGWLKLWSTAWLQDAKMKSLGDILEASYIRLLCAANDSLCYGRFAVYGDIPLTKAQICVKARITESTFDSLCDPKLGLISKDGETYYITKWEAYQNKNSKYFMKKKVGRMKSFSQNTPKAGVLFENTPDSGVFLAREV